MYILHHLMVELVDDLYDEQSLNLIYNVGVQWE